MITIAHNIMVKRLFIPFVWSVFARPYVQYAYYLLNISSFKLYHKEFHVASVIITMVILCHARC